MATLIKEETQMNGLNGMVDCDEEFLLPLEDPLALHNVDVKFEADEEARREVVEEIDELIQESKAVYKNTMEEMLQLGGQVETSQKHEDQDKRSSTLKKYKPSCYICTTCHVGFHKKDLLLQHMNIVHADVLTYPCRHCGKKFKTLEQRKKHETIHDKHRFEGEPKFACNQCDKKYHIKGSLESHVKKTHLGRKFKKKRLSVPITEHHSVGVRAPPKKAVKNVFQCDKCDLQFDYRCKLRKHMKVHSDARLHNCEICGQGFKSSSNLVGHLRKVHKNPNPNKPRKLRPKFMSGDPCPCPTCGKIYDLPSQLERHLRSHTGEKPYVCSICGFACALKQGLKLHQQQRHFQNKMLMFKCTRCGKEFSSFSAFRKHVELHNPIHNGKAFGCSICGKPFYTRANAAVCTVFGHDPTSLLKEMFQFRCCKCPAEAFGYHSLIALRKHWTLEHGNITLPCQYRAGIYDGNGMLKKQDDVLPNVVIPMTEAKKLKETGIPPMKLEYPLFIEFETDEDVEFVNTKRGRPRKMINQKENNDTRKGVSCQICSMTFYSNFNLQRHMKLSAHVKVTPSPRRKRRQRLVSSHSDFDNKRKEDLSECVSNNRQLLTKSEGEKVPIRSVKLKELRIVLKKVELNHSHCQGSPKYVVESEACRSERLTVNVNDKRTIKSILGNKYLKVQLFRLTL